MILFASAIVEIPLLAIASVLVLQLTQDVAYPENPYLRFQFSRNIQIFLSS